MVFAEPSSMNQNSNRILWCDDHNLKVFQCFCQTVWSEPLKSSQNNIWRKKELSCFSRNFKENTGDTETDSKSGTPICNINSTTERNFKKTRTVKGNFILLEHCEGTPCNATSRNNTTWSVSSRWYRCSIIRIRRSDNSQSLCLSYLKCSHRCRLFHMRRMNWDILRSSKGEILLNRFSPQLRTKMVDKRRNWILNETKRKTTDQEILFPVRFNSQSIFNSLNNYFHRSHSSSGYQRRLYRRPEAPNVVLQWLAQDTRQVAETNHRSRSDIAASKTWRHHLRQ